MTQKKIDKLTPEQEAMIPVYLNQCLEAGLSTEPVNRPLVEKLVVEVYEERGLTPPKRFHWGDSPYAISMMQKEMSGAEAQVPLMRGGMDLDWLGFYGFLTEVLGLEWDGNLKPHLELARNSGWWMPFEEDVFLSDRPRVLKRDAENNLHCEDGPAIAYADGWELYFWHGTSIPKEWIMDKKNVDVSLALTWQNIEQRRCLAEIIGWEKVLDQLNPTTIDKDEDPQIGTLVEVDLPDSDGPSRFICVKCGTGRDFVIPVPLEMRTALEANSWTYGLTPEDFAPEFRT